MTAHRNGHSSSREATRQTWRDRLERFADSPLSVGAFCQRERVSVPSFYYWKRQLGAAPHADAVDAPRLLPVSLSARPDPVELALPDGLVLRLVPGCDLDFVRILIQALGRPAC